MSNKLLFCFTHAGGTTTFYDQIGNNLEPGVTVVKLEYSGHGKRHKEPLFDTIQATAQDLYQSIVSAYGDKLNESDSDYALFGYSMGSLVALDVLGLILSNSKLKKPTHVFIAAHEPMSKIEFLNYPQDEIDEYVKSRTIKFGGVPEKLVDNKSFWRMYLPIYKADYLMIARYEFEKIDTKTEIPVTVFYSEEDTKLEDMKHWKTFFTGHCEFIKYQGKHFFINEYHKEMADNIRHRLECQ